MLRATQSFFSRGMHQRKLLQNPGLRHTLPFRQSSLLSLQTMCFSKQNGPLDDDKYVSDEEGAEFDSDRRFSNYVLFAGALALGAVLTKLPIFLSKLRQLQMALNGTTL